MQSELHACPPTKLPVGVKARALCNFPTGKQWKILNFRGRQEFGLCPAKGKSIATKDCYTMAANAV